MKNWSVTVQLVSERTITVSARTPQHAREVALEQSERDVAAGKVHWDKSKFDAVFIG